MLIKKDFYFVRHGQTDANANPSWKIDHVDIPLNRTGVRQAHGIEPIIAALPIKHICFSPLKRAKETKEICCVRHERAFESEIQNLTECGSEIWERMTQLGKRAHFHFDEPVFSFMQRVLEGVNDALSREGPVLIVAHGGVHWAICCWMQVEHDWMIDNCVPVHFTVSVTGQWMAKKLV